ncbi:berberine bridge enzyme-like Cyn d 4 [Phragmites australis]|uniref:berberine bridge enzyme-like Cyn d 4 n=1 Tax=Phragmites australis TaxID=29695 RepID=UPI002D787A2A|nr:berberine bridge enzyme-like Cyn d 4 [Phragmites australis]
MARSRAFALVLLFCALSASYHFAVSAPPPAKDDFLSCLTKGIPPRLLYAKSSPAYASVWSSTVRNIKFLSDKTLKPLYIVTPTDAAHIQAAVTCGRRYGMRIRVRSGGHDYEGLSYRSEKPEPFAVVDLSKMRYVHIDGKAGTAWVDSGAQLGELYYAIARATPKFGFPAGVCATIGVGGHFSGGGFGMLLRKYGTAADNVIDVKVVDANGKLLNRKSMGEDHFWAIRGGGGESFGIVVAWQVKLVPVPPTVTVFQVHKGIKDGAIDLITKWQEVAPAFPDDLMIRIMAMGQDAMFEALYLGTCKNLLPLMSSRFPELGLNNTHCKEMSWIQSVPYIPLGPKGTIKDLLNRTSNIKAFGKYKSDYVREPIPKSGWEKIFTWLVKPGAGVMIMDPYGGKISATDEAATPFPHRKGILFNIQYVSYWFGEGASAVPTQWSRDMYAFMEPYVSKNPREAYVNYRDLDLGVNQVVGNVSTYDSGKVWGEKYFKGNFKRLAMTKGKVDPDDYFRNEQSIPPLLK